MVENQQSPFRPYWETVTPDSSFLSPSFWMKNSEKSPVVEADPAMGAPAEDSFDSMILVSGSRLVQSGFREMDCGDDFVMFVNSGGSAIEGRDSHINFLGDSYFQGGDVINTNEEIVEGGDHPSLYQSARYGNFCYKFDGLAPGDYFVDLHFAEIVNTYGPKGIRVFDVSVQEEKILSEFDIYAVVGANKPLQLVDIRVLVLDNGVIVIRFEGISGTPTVCGICIRKAPKLSAPLVKPEHLICNKCASEIEFSPTQTRARSRSIAKYEKKIQELSSQYKLKSDECYEAWMSLTATNEQLERLRMELDNKLFQTETLEQAVEKQTGKLRDVSERYEQDKKLWFAAISNLEGKIKAMKHELSQLSIEAHECANSTPDLNKMIIAVRTLVTQCEDLKIKYSEEIAKRKKLYNQVQETKGNIRVFCRCRPLTKEEVLSGCTTIVDFDAAKEGDIGIMTGGSTKKTFKFDRVYTPKDGQADVYADASPLVTSALDGYNVCIFAYGQTGTGKTFTMEGTEQNRGVNYRTLEELFRIAAERKETFTYNISVSVLEVYNEQIRDLLATFPSTKKLEVRQAAEGFHHVPGIVEAKVKTIKEVWDVLQTGSNARAVGSNNVNEHSSRSHCMLCIMVRAKNLMNGESTKSKLWLIDLAGSERLTKTDVQGERLKEAQNINRSLSALGDVMSALATKSSHIPYRNSKLTHLLQDSLGGDSKALMFVQISPSDNDLGETLSSLNFASRVRSIELGPARKQVDTGELHKMKQMLDKVRQESRIKDESFRKLEEHCQNLENKLRGKEQLCRNFQEKNKELESQLESKAVSQNLSEKQYWQLSEKLKGKEDACITLQQKVKELEYKLNDQQHSESMILQQKVKELECKLKEQLYSESVAVRKVKELEYKLKERLQSELMLEQKVKQLENKLREERVQSKSMFLFQSDDALRFATPTEGKAFSRDESRSETDPQVLQSSNSINKPMSGQGSILLRGAEPLHEIKRKRELRNAMVGESENNITVPTPLVEKRVQPSELDKVRKIDPAKAFGRLTRKVVATRKVFPHSRNNQEKDKIKVWAR
ncbi:kinesin-like protein KIN-14E isoform X2 [Phoenix dactylifera]|uniref:Kinesin-like protein KIN-14E isoform X2 n=1 Tax=Phoenix dactylifera TaxID=42345 RepID=A0A8B9AEY8_PHODC|nr:kinesin-like protein KIN-14E isoform X2 [Phoenix dactylifera]